MDSLFSPAPPSCRSTTPPSAPTTDFDVIEAQKENIRPTPGGRSAATLSTLLDKASVVDDKVQEGHERFRRQIAEAQRRELEGEDMEEGVLDVLDVHNRYVAFNVEHHPTSSNHLIPLLESTTRKFISDDRYKQDLRHVKLWVQFSRLIERREEVWAFLESRDIGTKHSLFYEEWAMALEGLNRKKKADEIFKLGIARRAQPLEKLKGRHAAFLERVMAVNGQIPEDEPSHPSAALQTPGRAILGQSASGPASTSIAGATQLAPSMRSSTKNNGAKMAIFADANGPGEAGEASEWADFGTRDGRRKENTIEATPWKGETMPQSAAKLRIAPRTPKIEVFKEMNDVDNSAIRPADNIFSRARQPPTEAELIKCDPLRYYNLAPSAMSEPLAGPSLPPPPSARKAPRPKSTKAGWRPTTWELPTDGPETRDSKGKIKERRVFPWTEVYKHDEEWSFEEVRARQRGLLGKEWRGEVQAWEHAWHAPGSSTPKKEEKKVRPPSPTVNTKLANREIAAMFDQTIHGGKLRDSDSESSDDESDEEEAAPIAVTATPLPPSRPIAMAMPTPSHSAVPPTPTPASSSTSIGRLNIFADENTVPSSAAKPAKLNVFAETPARTPLNARSEGGSASRPRGFGIFSENENDQPAIDATPVPVRKALGNPFATPALSSKGPARRMLSMSIPEEAAETEETAAVEPDVAGRLNSLPDEAHAEDEEDDEEEMPRRRGGRFVPHNAMTPITERTCEFTTHTQLSRSSLSGSQLGQSTRRSSMRGEQAIVEEEEAIPAEPVFVEDKPPTPPNVFDPATVLLEQEQGIAQASMPSRDSVGSFSPHEAFVDGTSPVRSDFDRSGSVDPPFTMPEGFTIHGAPETIDRSMAIIDRTATERFSLERSLIDKIEEEEPEETGHFVTATAGLLPDIPADLPNPCNPVDEATIGVLLSRIDPPLAALPGFIDKRNELFARLPALQKHSKAKVRRASQSSKSSAAADDAFELELMGRGFEVVDKIGEGGFGAVFLAIDLAKREEADEKSDASDDEEEDFMVAIKVEAPSSIWEAVVVDRIHRRLDSTASASIIRTKGLYAFQDESYLFLDFSSQGTLLDLVNKATQLNIAPATPGAPPAVDELLAVFFTVELLRVVESLHSAGFIHGDLKIDNCLVRLDSTPSSGDWATQYSPTGENGWRSKGVRLIDFGRAVDMTLFSAGEKQEFVADWPHDERDCLEMREGRAWSYQTDYSGLASVAYCLLFGKYIQTEVVEIDGGRKCKITTPLKRYWQTELWTELFDTLLNPKSARPDQSLPITPELGAIRTKFESWLVDNCQKNGKNLKQMLKKVETAAMVNKRY